MSKGNDDGNDAVYRLVHHSSKVLDIVGTKTLDHFFIDSRPYEQNMRNFKLINVEERQSCIQLLRILSVTGVPRGTAKVFCFIMVFTSLPWTSICVASPDNTAPLPSIISGSIAVLRVACGESIILEIVLALRQFLSMRAFDYWTIANQTFSSACMKTGALCTVIGLFIIGVLLATMFGIAGAPALEFWILLTSIGSASFLILGFGLGCRRRLPLSIAPHIANPNRLLMIRYRHWHNCGWNEYTVNNCSELCVQQNCALISVDDGQDLSRWLNVQYLQM
eukprot:g2072.t1